MHIGKGKAPTYIKMLPRGPRGRIFKNGSSSITAAMDFLPLLAHSVIIPLLSPAIALIKKYRLKKGDLSRNTVFPYVSNQILNRNLKIINEICGFGFPLNFYVSRYTFATTITLFHAVPITSIKEMMGHKKIETTAHLCEGE